jgi:predicted phosphodiesterase
MFVLLISDIHSNLAALGAVVQDAEADFDIDETWALGDLVGCGPDPAECLKHLRSKTAIGVAGNHDLAVAGVISTELFNPMASAATERTRTLRGEADIAWLGALPTQLKHHGITLVHGSPRNPIWEYVDGEVVLSDLSSRGIAVGHTHSFAIFERSEGSTNRIRVEYSAWHSLAMVPFLVNPGSVGQPRDSNPTASYAILDLTHEAITHRRVDYDFERTIKLIQDSELPNFLADRLRSGI